MSKENNKKQDGVDKTKTNIKTKIQNEEKGYDYDGIVQTEKLRKIWRKEKLGDDENNKETQSGENLRDSCPAFEFYSHWPTCPYIHFCSAYELRRRQSGPARECTSYADDLRPIHALSMDTSAS